MEQSRRGTITFGVLLILLGGWFLALQVVPGLSAWADNFLDWPVWVIGVGLVFLVAAVLGGTPGLAVPAAIISGTGGILYYQNVTGDWDSWAYLWTLYPGFVGIGVFLSHALEGNLNKAVREGGGGIVASAFLFGIFGSFLGGPAILRQYWPVLLIVWGLWLLVRSMWVQRREI
jgi:hypothetical protein